MSQATTCTWGTDGVLAPTQGKSRFDPVSRIQGSLSADQVLHDQVRTGLGASSALFLATRSRDLTERVTHHLENVRRDVYLVTETSMLGFDKNWDARREDNRSKLLQYYYNRAAAMWPMMSWIPAYRTVE